MQRIRDNVQHPVSLDYFQERLSAGWRLRAIEWEREERLETGKAPPQVHHTEPPEPVPYGFQLESMNAQLEYNPRELSVLMAILEMIVLEKGISYIAEELNLRGYRTRLGTAWTSPAVFNLLPRLIDMGPRLLKSPDWQARRPSGSAH
jgi:hypothetical protein